MLAVAAKLLMSESVPGPLSSSHASSVPPQALNTESVVSVSVPPVSVAIVIGPVTVGR